MVIRSSRATSIVAVVSYWLCACGLLAVADTEIRNFHLPLPSATSSIPSSVSTLDVASGSSNHNVSHEKSDIWLSWSPLESYDSWTARVSWPASSPTRFNIDISSQDASDTILIHISSSLLSPRISGMPFSSLNGPVTVGKDEYFTPFTLTLEPLLLGALPKTAVPAIMWIVVFGLGAACTVPALRRAIEGAHTWADREEIKRKNV